MFIALLDTCVLWPSLQRDFLLSLSLEQLYRPIWSSAILEELKLKETKKLVERGANEDEAAADDRRFVTPARLLSVAATVPGSAEARGRCVWAPGARLAFVFARDRRRPRLRDCVCPVAAA